MRLDNVTDMVAGYTMGMKPDGRELLVVCVKATYDFPNSGEVPRLSKNQLPLVQADTFTGDPGLSAPLVESDYAYFKPRCDILLNGAAHAPHRQPVRRVPVSLQFGSMQKSFVVVGDRFWQNGLLSLGTTPPRPFITLPITYDRAFGGVDRIPADPAKHVAMMENPVGVGFHQHLDSRLIDGNPLPNTEAVNQPIKNPTANTVPCPSGPSAAGGSRARPWPVLMTRNGWTTSSPSCRPILTKPISRPHPSINRCLIQLVASRWH